MLLGDFDDNGSDADSYNIEIARQIDDGLETMGLDNLNDETDQISYHHDDDNDQGASDDDDLDDTCNNEEVEIFTLQSITEAMSAEDLMKLWEIQSSPLPKHELCTILLSGRMAAFFLD